MKSAEIFGKNYVRNFLIFLLLIFLIGTAMSALILFINVHRPLTTHYSAALSIVNQLKESLIVESLKINVLFMLLTVAAIAVLTLVYSNRIAGPLYRIKLRAKSVSEGNLDPEIRFRRNDAINSFAESLNNLTRNHQMIISSLDAEIKQMKSLLNKFKDISVEARDNDALLTRMSEADRRIKDIFKNIKF